MDPVSRLTPRLGHRHSPAFFPFRIGGFLESDTIKILNFHLIISHKKTEKVKLNN